MLRADVALSPDNRSRGHGTVLLASAEDAGRAMDMFHGYNWQGRVLEVRLDRMGPQLGDVGGGGVGVGVGVGIGMVPGAMGMGVGLDAMGVNGMYSASAGAGGLYVPSPHAQVNSHFLSPSSSGQLAGSSPLPSLTSSLSTSSSIASSLGSSGAGLSFPSSLTPAQLQLLLQQQHQQQRSQQQQQQPVEISAGHGQTQEVGLGLSLQQVQQLQQLQQSKELSNEDVYALIAAMTAANNNNNNNNNFNLDGSMPASSSSSSGNMYFGNNKACIDLSNNGFAEYPLGPEYGLGALERERSGFSASAMGGLSSRMGLGVGERPVSGLGGLNGFAGVGSFGVGMRSLFVGNVSIPLFSLYSFEFVPFIVLLLPVSSFFSSLMCLSFLFLLDGGISAPISLPMARSERSLPASGHDPPRRRRAWPGWAVSRVRDGELRVGRGCREGGGDV